MQRSHLVLGGLVALALVAAAPAWLAQDMPQPTAEHRALVAGAGEWEGTVTIFDMAPEPQAVPARETVTAIGGYWIQSHFESEFMGQPYIGTGCVGYDPAKKKYVGTWIDSMSSWFALMEGEVDASGALVMRWMSPDMTGQIVPHRSESVETAHGRTMTFYAGEGEGRKGMVIEMKRKAAGAR